MFYVYKITNIINNKIYIGQTITTIKKRWDSHIRASCLDKPTMLISLAIKKFGLEYFSIEEIDRSKNINDINIKEIYWINFYNSRHNDIGYNVSRGGGNSINKKKYQLVSKNQVYKIRFELSKGHHSFNDISNILNIDYDTVRAIYHNQYCIDKNYIKQNYDKILKKGLKQRSDMSRGLRSYKSKFSYQDIVNIRSYFYYEKLSCDKLSKIYNVSNNTILDLIRLKSYADIPAPYSLKKIKEIILNNKSINGMNQGPKNKGEKHGMNKYSDDLIQKIRTMYSTGNFTQKYIADCFNVLPKYVSRIVTGERRGKTNIDVKQIKDKTVSYSGNKNPAAKLTTEIVKQIRAEMKYSTKDNIVKKYTEIYKVSKTSIYYILNNKTWNNV